MSLTKRQNEVLSFIRDFLDENSYSPTLEEIADHFGLASLNGVHKHLTVLEERGFIHRLSNRARSIEVIKHDDIDYRSVPLLGVIAAGHPIEAVSSSEFVSIPEQLLTRGNNYVLRVEGESMIEEQITDGDLIIVEERSFAHNGETVVALIDGENTTLKRYYREGKFIRLQPANPDFSPIFIEENRLRIQGVVVGLMRKY
jgi:repressor LexA